MTEQLQVQDVRSIYYPQTFEDTFFGMMMAMNPIEISQVFCLSVTEEDAEDEQMNHTNHI